MQLSWNYNYVDAGTALNENLCAAPDLVATDASIAWGKFYLYIRSLFMCVTDISNFSFLFLLPFLFHNHFQELPFGFG